MALLFLIRIFKHLGKNKGRLKKMALGIHTLWIRELESDNGVVALVLENLDFEKSQTRTVEHVGVAIWPGTADDADYRKPALSFNMRRKTEGNPVFLSIHHETKLVAGEPDDFSEECAQIKKYVMALFKETGGEG